jgi:hypothetical protein
VLRQCPGVTGKIVACSRRNESNAVHSGMSGVRVNLTGVAKAASVNSPSTCRFLTRLVHKPAERGASGLYLAGLILIRQLAG